MKLFMSYAVMLLLGVSMLYVGISGYIVLEFEARVEREKRNDPSPTPQKPIIYNGEAFGDLLSARRAQEQDKINEYFEWVFKVPPALPVLLTSLAFGILGGVAAVVQGLVNAQHVAFIPMLLRPVLGGLIGLMVFGIAITAPKLIVESAEGVRPLALIFLCLFAGTFSDHVYRWVEEKTKSMFPLEPKTA